MPAGKLYLAFSVLGTTSMGFGMVVAFVTMASARFAYFAAHLVGTPALTRSAQGHTGPVAQSRRVVSHLMGQLWPLDKCAWGGE
eukprot:5139053-Alexandrium_andersonii.AAC.1